LKALPDGDTYVSRRTVMSWEHPWVTMFTSLTSPSEEFTADPDGSTGAPLHQVLFLRRGSSWRMRACQRARASSHRARPALFEALTCHFSGCLLAVAVLPAAWFGFSVLGAEGVGDALVGGDAVPGAAGDQG
jgi:hypothetical protein